MLNCTLSGISVSLLYVHWLCSCHKTHWVNWTHWFYLRVLDRIFTFGRYLTIIISWVITISQTNQKRLAFLIKLQLLRRNQNLLCLHLCRNKRKKSRKRKFKCEKIFLAVVLLKHLKKNLIKYKCRKKKKKLLNKFDPSNKIQVLLLHSIIKKLNSLSLKQLNLLCLRKRKKSLKIMLIKRKSKNRNKRGNRNKFSRKEEKINKKKVKKNKR